MTTLSRSGAKMRNTGVATATPMNDPRLWERRAKSASSAATARNSPASTGFASRSVDSPKAASIPMTPSAALPFA